MKIAVFQNGRSGRPYRLAEDAPETELEELLGGETEMVPINDRLKLVTRADGEAERLPIRYALHRLGRAAEPIAGDCAVVAVRPDGRLKEMTEAGLEAAGSYVRRVAG